MNIASRSAADCRKTKKGVFVLLVLQRSCWCNNSASSGFASSSELLGESGPAGVRVSLVPSASKEVEAGSMTKPVQPASVINV